MGIVASFIDRRVGTELNERGVLVWYDPARAWQHWVQTAHGQSPPGAEATAAQVTIGGRKAHLVVSTGSHYEVLQVCEPLVNGSDPPRLLVYVPGEPYLEMLSPLRELECLGGEKEPYQRELTQVARQALQSAGLSESKIDELLNREGLDFAYLDSISVGDGGASPLAPVFGSSRELDVIPSFLTEPELRRAAAAKGLLPEVARLASQWLGLPLSAVSADGKADESEVMAQELARALLVAEMRSDLDGAEPVAISQIPAPSSEEQVERVRAVCQRIRREQPAMYELLADKIESDLGLADAGIDAEALGCIDTFRFEEQSLLAACDRHLAAGESDRALSIVEDRLAKSSFWVSVSRFAARHATWEAAGELASLALTVRAVQQALEKPPADVRHWVDAYSVAGGWHLVDQRFRRARYRLSRLEDGSALEAGATSIFSKYDELLERMAAGFVAKLEESRWQIDGIRRQEELYDRYVARQPERIAYILADALRFEMGAELAVMMESIGAKGVKLEPAVAVAPTITDLGMVALLPGAEKSFSMAEVRKPKGVAGAISGKAIVQSRSRMDHAKGEVPGLVEMTLDRLNDIGSRKRADELENASVVIIRSQEIDGIGENLPSGVAQKVMGTVLEDLRTGIHHLAEAGVSGFVVVADHGHLFGSRREDDMKIDAPEGGQQVDIHRRCWVGRGGSTPSSCVRLSSSDLGYEGTDLELVVPRGTGVFKAGGSLAFHHGGLSLQELVIPVLTFELQGKKPSSVAKADVLRFESVPKEITNRIFSIVIALTQFDLVKTHHVRVLGISTANNETVAQASFATRGWNADARILDLVGSDPIDVGLQLDDDTTEELRIVVVEVGTDRTLKDSEPIPVKVIR